MKSIIRPHVLLLLGLTAVLVAACSPAASDFPGPEPHVLATETFLGDIAQNVAGSRLQVQTLLSVNMDPHEYQPTPRDAVKISESQVLILNGVGYEKWFEKTLNELNGQRRIVVAANGLTPNPSPSALETAGDPHLWMNPLNVIRYVQNIRDGLSQADPAGAAVYSANADAYIVKLTELDGWVKSEIAQLPPEKRLLVTNHDALGYFSQAYGFKVVGVVIPSVTPEASPSAQQMAGLIDAIKASGAPAIFLDISENRTLAQQIATESGAKVVTDLYVETLSAPNGPAPTYLDMIRHDVTAIVSALK